MHNLSRLQKSYIILYNEDIEPMEIWTKNVGSAVTRMDVVSFKF